MAMYKHYWRCEYCGYDISRQSTRPDMPTPMVSANCKKNPSGKQFDKHLMVKVRTVQLTK